MKRYGIVAGWLALATAFLGAPAGAQRDNNVAPGQQTPQAFEKQITRTVGLRYLLYLPPDYGKNPAARWPLVLFLHGSGERGNELEKLKVHGPPKRVAQGQTFPFILVSPQLSAPGGWDTETLGALLDEVAAKYAVDADRVYVTGLSLGGFGTWALAQAYPFRFAAIAPIAAGGRPGRMRTLAHLPVWAFHGAKDPTVPLSAGQEMVDALKAAGGNVKFTIYPDAGHDSWTVPYGGTELYDWLLQQRRVGDDPEPQTTARLRAVAEDAARGKLPADRIAPDARERLTTFAQNLARRNLSAPRTFQLIERRDESGTLTRRYRADYGDTPAIWTFTLNADGAITAMSLVSLAQ